MKTPDRKVILISNIIAAIVFAVMAAVFYFRGETTLAAVFAVLTPVQIAFTLFLNRIFPG